MGYSIGLSRGLNYVMDLMKGACNNCHFSENRKVNYDTRRQKSRVGTPV